MPPLVTGNSAFFSADERADMKFVHRTIPSAGGDVHGGVQVEAAVVGVER
jgi:hypothetical protein